ncbi:MAG: 50S ribosomal protein L9 [Rhodospirillales bacterium]|nr:50S ribosomal protein L9 [Alphaproteobacteria bacterium]MCB1839334.1 50S ribosomal protein L9 [Alphaproteobacteria bacterium]MCB9977318.1 50S ribosomal protein L9 [Rhodospirillales bacterium]
MSATKIILLEHVENLGEMGDVVTVKPGYARNFLLPQKKALRASKENVAYFEAQKKHLAAENEKRKKEAQKLADKINGLKIPLIRQASEGGQLYGSVNARDIADAILASSKVTVERNMVRVNQNFKMLGLFPVDIMVHPEIKVTVTINIARSLEEAETQAKTGQALIAGESQSLAEAQAEEVLKDVLDEEGLEAQKAKKAHEEEEKAEESEREAKSKEREAKKAKKAKKDEASAEDESEAGAEEEGE